MTCTRLLQVTLDNEGLQQHVEPVASARHIPKWLPGLKKEVRIRNKVLESAMDCGGVGVPLT